MTRRSDSILIAVVVWIGTSFVSADELTTDRASDDLFRRVDSNGDGWLTADEVPENGRRLLERLLRTADEDGDDRISREEFAVGLAPKRLARPLEQKRPSRPAAERMEAMVRDLDRNGDGRIVADEVPERLQPLFQRMLTRGDRNSDGVLGRRELGRAAPELAKFVRAGRSGRFSEKAFKKFDANGDGKVEIEEIPERRRKAFEKMLAKADADSDGALDNQEFAQIRLAMRESAGSGRREARVTDRPHAIGGGLMRILDTDSDGALSAEEISAASSTLRRLDEDGDGTISRRELWKNATATD